MPEDTAAPPPMEMPPPPKATALKAAVIVMGVLLVAGFVLVVATIVKRASDPTPAALSTGPGGRFGVSDIHVAPGEKVKSVVMSEDRIAIHLAIERPGAAPEEEIVIVAVKTGAELGRIRLRPLNDFAENGGK